MKIYVLSSGIPHIVHVWEIDDDGGVQVKQMSDKEYARDKIKQALKSGKIKVPMVCSACGRESPHGLAVYHSDYKKPLNFHLLCPKCYRKNSRGEIDTQKFEPVVAAG